MERAELFGSMMRRIRKAELVGRGAAIRIDKGWGAWEERRPDRALRAVEAKGRAVLKLVGGCRSRDITGSGYSTTLQAFATRRRLSSSSISKP
ncbi:hypothetical protein NL676_003105 [Syzygium grande]|nr:hypothetical protein NL676_003105 [Syzygium grande]